MEENKLKIVHLKLCLNCERATEHQFGLCHSCFKEFSEEYNAYLLLELTYIQKMMEEYFESIKEKH